MKTIKVGLVGAGHRGIGLIGSIFACGGVEVVAVADLYEERIEKAKAEVKKISGKEPKGYSDGYKLIKDPDVEAVVVASYWEEHVNLAVASMRAGKYTAVEVGGAYDVEDCWMLVRTYEETKTPIMLLENCCFGKFELTATASYTAELETLKFMRIHIGSYNNNGRQYYDNISYVMTDTFVDPTK
jgi:predicted dehydrogenase